MNAKKSRRATRTCPKIRLPALDTHQALLLVDLLERTSRALWRAYGDAMADRLAALGVETPQSPDDIYTHATGADSHDDDDTF